MDWCVQSTAGYDNVSITNFSGSFANGLAYCALIHRYCPREIDYRSLSPENKEHNLRLAIDTATVIHSIQILINSN